MEEAAPREPSPHRRHERRIERYYVGVNFPGVNAGMFFTDKVAAELRAQYLSKVFVGGGRLYIYPEIGGFHARDIRVYFGAEADFISAKGEVSEGNGFAMEAFGGMEYYFSRALSFMFDIGPAYVTIHDRSTALSSDGLHFVLNSSINYHF